jgi:putative addiction module component (TIGR02574 family)
MSPALQKLRIDGLSNEERLKLIAEIWESLSPIDQLEIPESHREELDRQLAAADTDPAPWHAVAVFLWPGDFMAEYLDRKLGNQLNG